MRTSRCSTVRSDRTSAIAARHGSRTSMLRRATRSLLLQRERVLVAGRDDHQVDVSDGHVDVALDHADQCVVDVGCVAKGVLEAGVEASDHQVDGVDQDLLLAVEPHVDAGPGHPDGFTDVVDPHAVVAALAEQPDRPEQDGLPAGRLGLPAGSGIRGRTPLRRGWGDEDRADPAGEQPAVDGLGQPALRDRHAGERSEAGVQARRPFAGAELGSHSADGSAPAEKLLTVSPGELAPDRVADPVMLPQVGDDERGIGERELHDLIEGSGERVLGPLVAVECGVAGFSRTRSQDIDGAEQDRLEDALLPVEVPVHGTGGDAHALRDVGQADRGEPAAGELLGGDPQDLGLAVARAPAMARGGLAPPRLFGERGGSDQGSVRSSAPNCCDGAETHLRGRAPGTVVRIAAGDIVNESSLVLDPASMALTWESTPAWGFWG